jgi:two-component system phosphate regulon sensor histidine kinase PhoR
MSSLFGRGRRRAAQSQPRDERTEGLGNETLVGLARALPQGVLLLDRNLRVIVANDAAGFIFGFDAARADGMHLIEAVPNVELERRAEDVLDGGAVASPLVATGKSGNLTYTISAYPMTGAGGEVRGVLILADDRTEYLALERARQDFMSNVSHELRTPLSSIKLMIETVISSPDDEVGDLFLPQALAQVDRLAELVGQLLEQARVESGQLLLRVREIDLESAVRPMVASLEPQAAEKGVTLNFAGLRPVTLEADPDRLAQVVVNLVDNALRHTPAGGDVRVEVDADGGDAILRVRDTGSGIPYKDLPHIFERFYVVDRSRARKSSGAGLGLSIVKQIVDGHGGRISAESMLGSGATFTVRLPMLHIRSAGS